MERYLYSHTIFVLFSLIAIGNGVGELYNASCSKSGAPCTKNEDCCSITNGRPYCDGETGRCDALRYCDPSSPNDCPFNDLSALEIANVIQIVRNYRRLGTSLQFCVVRNQEPKKKEWNAGKSAAFERVAYAVVFDIDSNRMWELTISLTKRTVISAVYRPDSVPPLTGYEMQIATEIAATDPRVAFAYEVRGLNASYAVFDVWSLGAQGSNANIPGRRRVRLLCNYQDPETRYMSWRPVEGLTVTIDIADKRITEIIDTKRNVPVPTSPLSSQSTVDHEMPSPPPPVSTSPSSFQVDGFHIKWENWKFQYSMDPVHGLQLYHVRYMGDCEERFLIYKMSISEMFVPYGANGNTWRWRGAFDTGEYKLGDSASPMMLGVDVPWNAQLISCLQVNDATGEVTVREGCIAIYERPVWPLYYHYEKDPGFHDAKSGTELVVSFMSTIGNYDYMYEYVFSMDGSIMVMVMATGMLISRAVINKKNDPNCIEDCLDYIHENAIGPLHQHYVSFRIDLDVDGASNMLLENNFVRDPFSIDNLDGGAFSLRRTIIPSETFLDASPPNARFWTTINPQSRNDFNTPRGYSIHPGSMTSTFLVNGLNPLNQAQFIRHPIWVTRYKDDEQAAASAFPRSGIRNQGLPEYIKDGASLRNADIVVWHTCGFSHAPRPEEHPFMNKHIAGFHLMPRNFLSANPMVKVRCDKHDH